MRVARTGYSDTPWVSENWVSASSPTGAMRWWMGDYIHRVNILTAHWTEIGIGVGTRGSEMIFVTVFSVGSGASGEVVAAAPPQDAPPPSVHIEQVTVPPEGLDYTVQGGDTLLAIGLRYGLPWERIAEANALNERSLLQIGQALRIPGSGAPIIPAIPDVETEDYTVQPNDTLYTIALRRDLYWDEVAAVNGFNENTVLQIGQVIQVPVVEVAQAAEAAPVATTRRESIGPVAPATVAGNMTDISLAKFDPGDSQPTQPTVSAAYSVGTGGSTDQTTQVALLSGDGVGATSAVLAAYEAKVETESLNSEVAVAANVTGDVTAPVAEAVEPPAEPALYTVQAGDTIISIAVAHGLEWGALLALNGLGEDSVLQLGQEIRLR
jgi:LysM repeat protein